jgi:hypothetical protein
MAGVEPAILFWGAFPLGGDSSGKATRVASHLILWISTMSAANALSKSSPGLPIDRLALKLRARARLQ